MGVILPDYITYNHSICIINYHFVWCTKYRNSVLTHDKEIIKIFQETYQQFCWTITAIEVIPDHVYVFITSPPFDAPSKSVKLLKGISARKLFKLFPYLREDLWEGHLWSPFYYCGAIGTVSSSTIKQYIDSQRLK